MQHDAQHWNNINNIPGQTIAFHKCKWQILAWRVINGNLQKVHSTDDVLVLKDNKGGAAPYQIPSPRSTKQGLGLLPLPRWRSEASIQTHMMPLVSSATNFPEHNSQRRRHAKRCYKDSSPNLIMDCTHHILHKSNALN
jgi:hypothetical protein